MDTIHPAIPLLALLLGAGTFTLSRYLVAPLTWRISSPFARYGLLNFAGLLAVVYLAILPAGQEASIIEAPTTIVSVTGIVLLGLGAGFLVIGIMLLFRRSQ